MQLDEIRNKAQRKLKELNHKRASDMSVNSTTEKYKSNDVQLYHPYYANSKIKSATKQKLQ